MPISGLTLALFQDMGWYEVNASVAEYWGKLLPNISAVVIADFFINRLGKGTRMWISQPSL